MEHILADGDTDPRVADAIEKAMKQQYAQLSILMKEGSQRQGVKTINDVHRERRVREILDITMISEIQDAMTKDI